MTEPRSSLKPLFLLAFVAGLGLAIYLYLVKFDDLSESQLVTLSPIWFLLVVFGAIGLKGESAADLVAKGDATDLHDGLKKAADSPAPIVYFGLIGLPSLIYNPAKSTSSPAVLALIMTAMWAVLLYAFFLGVFPNL